MDSAQHAVIVNFAEDSVHTSGVMARNIRTLVDSIFYPEIFILLSGQSNRVAGNGSGNSNTHNNQIDKTLSNNTLKVYPNPAKEYFTVEYHLESSAVGNSAIQLTDATGVVVFTQNIEGADNQIVVESSKIAAGIYYLHLMVGNTKCCNVKVLINK